MTDGPERRHPNDARLAERVAAATPRGGLVLSTTARRATRRGPAAGGDSAARPRPAHCHQYKGACNS
eukprot:scaffold3767_cov242-Prasinococcus_capsulatus_cf.AAC.12